MRRVRILISVAYDKWRVDFARYVPALKIICLKDLTKAEKPLNIEVL
jgi:hypothetical protein